MIWDRQTLIIFLSLIIGVTITGKLDILPFRILVVIAILILFCLNSHSLYFSGGDCALILLISVGAAIDEIGNDLADAKILKRLIGVFFLYRGYLKILISLIALFHYLPIIYTTAFLTFDLGYLLIARLSAQRQAKQLYHCT
jgi:hypothetical protein